MSAMIEIRKIKRPVGYLYCKEESGRVIYLGGITDSFIGEKFSFQDL